MSDGLFDMCCSRRLLTFITQTPPEHIGDHILAGTQLHQDGEEEQTELPGGGGSERGQVESPRPCLL